jgi:hypothetical protein
MTMKPISPSEAREKKVTTFPDGVIEAFNEAILEAFDGKRATVLQKDVLARICSKLDVESGYVYARKWLDVEQVFEDAGWSVKYDKPSYGDSNFDAYFVFEKE